MIDTAIGTCVDELTTRNISQLLCIDDDPDISEAIAARFQHYEIDVLRAYHGMQGYWMAMTEKPDLIITDVRMPVEDGNFVIECLKGNQETFQIPIIVLTGQRDRRLASRLISLGAETVLHKPVETAVLFNAVKRHFRPIHNQGRVLE